jgi:hypothetical protein
MMMTLIMVMWAGLEWLRYFLPTQPNPWINTTIAVLAGTYSLWQFRKFWPQIKAMKLAEEGEKAVGQFLEGLRGFGYQVFHDVVGPSFNVDHVIIGPGGVFTVETKTWKKPRKGSPKVVFDGERLTAGGFPPERNPVVQAKAQADWLGSILEQSTGRKFKARPVILFPGWWVEATKGSQRDLWVLEPKALPAFLEHQEDRLSPEDVKLAAFHLSRYIREQERVLDAAK